MRSSFYSPIGSFFFANGCRSELSRFLVDKFGLGSNIVVIYDSFFREDVLVDQLGLNNTSLKLTLIAVQGGEELTTSVIDSVVDEIKTRVLGEVSAVIGLGGGTALDSGKAVSVLLGNGGQAADFQGWDIPKLPGVYKIGVPTLPGTGAEASRTCVLLNPEKNLKLGINSDYSTYDVLVIDPELSETVPRYQYFVTGMDTYIHCFESLSGSYRQAIGDAYSREALNICRDVFSSDDMMTAGNREKMAAASFLGGSAIGMGFVGLVHPFSAGLSTVFGIPHCEANCIALKGLRDFYPSFYDEFENFKVAQGITVKQGVARGATDSVHARLFESTLKHEKPLENSLGKDFKKILTKQVVKNIFEEM